MNTILSILVRSSGATQPARGYAPVKSLDIYMYFTRVEEILLDDSFYLWYLQTDTEVVKRWNDWRLENENNSQLLENAVSALHSLLNQQDEEGYPRKIHAVATRLQRAKEKQGNKTGSDVLPDNKADIPDMGKFDIELS